MGMFDIFRRKQQISGDANTVAGQISHLNSQETAGVEINPTSASKHEAVMTCIGIKASAVGSLPLKLYVEQPDGSRKLVKKGKNATLFTKRPNDFQTMTTFMEHYMTAMSLYGNFYCAINRNLLGKPMEIVPFRYQQNVQCDMDMTTGELYYTYTTNDSRGVTTYNNRFANEDIIHIRESQTLDGFLGVSPLRYAAMTMGMSIAAQEHSNNLLKNGAKLNGFLSIEGNFEDDGDGQQSFSRMKEEWRNGYNGSDSSGTVPILEGGVKFNPLSMSATDAQLIDQLNFGRRTIASIFRVPYHRLNGESANLKYNNLSEANTSFVRDELGPYLNKMKEALDFLLPENHEVMFDVREYSSSDEKGLTDMLTKQLEAGVITPNEMRERLGYYNKIEGADLYNVRSNNRMMGTYVGLPSLEEQMNSSKPSEPTQEPETEENLVDEDENVQEESE